MRTSDSLTTWAVLNSLPLTRFSIKTVFLVVMGICLYQAGQRNAYQQGVKDTTSTLLVDPRTYQWRGDPKRMPFLWTPVQGRKLLREKAGAWVVYRDLEDGTVFTGSGHPMVERLQIDARGQPVRTLESKPSCERLFIDTDGCEEWATTLWAQQL